MSVKLKVATTVQNSELPCHVKIPLLLLITKSSDQEITDFVTGLHNFLKNDSDKMRETIETKFPELFSTPRRKNHNNGNDGLREDVSSGEVT